MRLVAICLCLLFVSCSAENFEDKIKEYQVGGNKISSKKEYDLVKMVEYTIQNPNLDHRFNRGSLDVLFQDSLLYFNFQNKIKILNLETETLSEVILDDFELRSDLIYLHPISKDSIVTLQRLPPILMINDSKGKIFYKETLPYFPFDIDDIWWKSMQSFSGKNNFNFNIQPLRNLFFDHKNQTIHIPILAVDYLFLKDVSDAETIGVFDLRAKNWKNGYGKSRGLMRYRGENNYSGVFDRNYFLVRGDTSYLSYPISHHIFLINNKTDELIAEILASPEVADPISSPIKKEWLTSSDFVKMNDWRSTTPFYSQLMYHEDNELFSRIYFHKMGLSNSFAGSYWENRDMTLLIFDKNLSLLDEIKLDPEVFELWRYIPTGDGMLVSEMNKQKDLENSDQILLGYTARYKINGK
ncbi:hypothetical protein [Algoriphagus sp.]|uniref:hypothetical protein n=1 Tax=Algoriphagus sp. TaxID=1872435 RepID=UPI00391BA446